MTVGGRGGGEEEQLLSPLDSGLNLSILLLAALVSRPRLSFAPISPRTGGPFSASAISSAVYLVYGVRADIYTANIFVRDVRA